METLTETLEAIHSNIVGLLNNWEFVKDDVATERWILTEIETVLQEIEGNIEQARAFIKIGGERWA